jgi:hypothetical protein
VDVARDIARISSPALRKQVAEAIRTLLAKYIELSLHMIPPDTKTLTQIHVFNHEIIYFDRNTLPTLNT